MKYKFIYKHLDAVLTQFFIEAPNSTEAVKKAQERFAQDIKFEYYEANV